MNYTSYTESDDETLDSEDDLQPPNATELRSSSASEKPSEMTYDEIKAKCLKIGRLFRDHDFGRPTGIDQSILYYGKRQQHVGQYKFCRPKVIVSNLSDSHKKALRPEFVVDGVDRFDVMQGHVGDCWMMAALACLSQHPNLRDKVIPVGQTFKFGDYAGIFRFNFWKFGKWVEVIIDDRLPTKEREDGKLIRRLVYAKSSQKTEFWTALLEKAYAKLYGSYKAIDGGYEIEAMEDFTGGIGEIHDLRTCDHSIVWSFMVKAQDMESLMCCSIDIKDMQNRNWQMVRLRNPWGNKDEWSGDWSDDSLHWKNISKSEKDKIKFVKKFDGEFWMSFDEFIKNFERLDICHLGPDSFVDDASSPKKHRWAMTCVDGCWKKGTTTGGHVSGPTAWRNPQYGFEVVDVDEDDNKDAGTVIIALMQKDRRKKGLENLEIGYAIYELKNPAFARLDKKFHFENVRKGLVKVTSMREVCGRHELTPGSYCVVPFTRAANEEADFILRFFTEKPLTSRELDQPTQMTRDLKSDATPASADLRKGMEVWEAFRKKSGEFRFRDMDAYQLKAILNAYFMQEMRSGGFRSETCKSLVALKDLDRSGKLGYREFMELWILLQTWKSVFKSLARNDSGTIDSQELRQATLAIGYSISNQTFNELVRACSNKDGKTNFDKFIRAMARLSSSFVVHKKMSRGRGDSNALLNLDQFLQTMMYS